jgi:hypothetical protein
MGYAVAVGVFAPVDTANHAPTRLIATPAPPMNSKGQAATPHGDCWKDRAGYRGENGSTGRPTLASGD